jgi:hypothetical protein
MEVNTGKRVDERNAVSRCNPSNGREMPFSDELLSLFASCKGLYILCGIN